MRISAWIQAGFVLLVAIGAWARPLSPTRRLKIVSMGGGAIVAILMTQFAVYRFSARSSSAIYDWLSAALLLVPYWQIGQFFTSPSQRVQDRLAAFDRKLVNITFFNSARNWLPPALDLYFELAYLIAYALIPAGLAVLYSAGLRHCADHYWAVVLVATYVCLASTPFVPALPPRLLADSAPRVRSNRVRLLNELILSKVSIQAITFPSAHVAAAVGASMVLLELVPWVGVIFAWLAISISVAAIIGGYHYVADVLLALVVAVLAFASLH